MFSQKKYKIGVALGGGGARGYAHLGVLQALQEKGIKPDVISAVSAGAVAGVFIASGKSPKEAFEIMKHFGISDFTKFRIPRNGLLSFEKLKKTIEREVKANNIEDLPIPMIVAVSDLLNGKAVYLQKGPLSTLVLASASIPVLFDPIHYNNTLYADGGIFNNLPIEPLKKKCQKIIGVSISPVQEISELSGLIDIATRTFQLTVNARHNMIKKNCDLFIEPPQLSEYDLLDTSNVDEIFEIGYQYTKSLPIDGF
jgi:NTE family protein